MRLDRSSIRFSNWSNEEAPGFPIVTYQHCTVLRPGPSILIIVGMYSNALHFVCIKLKVIDCSIRAPRWETHRSSASSWNKLCTEVFLQQKCYWQPGTYDRCTFRFKSGDGSSFRKENVRKYRGCFSFFLKTKLTIYRQNTWFVYNMANDKAINWH